MNTILTDDERPKLPPEAGSHCVDWDFPDEAVTFHTREQIEAYADAREAAVLAKLAAQEPVGWLNPVGGYLSDHYIKNYSTGLEREKHTIPVYVAPQPAVVQVPKGWQPIETAPKDGTPVLGFCVHEADPYFDGDRLTDYGARVEGLSHVENGIHAIRWEDAREEQDGRESPNYRIPGGWIHYADAEQMANPTHWMPLPAAPEATMVRGDQRGLIELREVVRCLRETGRYIDEEGEATNALEELLAAAPQADMGNPMTGQPIPPQWREAMKVAREALPKAQKAYWYSAGKYGNNNALTMDLFEIVKALQAVAQLDALGGVE